MKLLNQNLGIVFLTFSFSFWVKESSSAWWLSSQVFAVGSNAVCYMEGLAFKQQQLCINHPKLMTKLVQGAKLALEECQLQFATKRWNCSVDSGDGSLLGRLMSRGNREAAFFYAISSAGVVNEITRSCSTGESINECGCEKNLAGRRTNDFFWYGCDDNIRFGIQFTKEFLDARERSNDARALMNKHNNYAGRIAVRNHMTIDCTCHGVSGSCAVKTCRRSLSPFNIVGDYLHEKYNSAAMVSLDQSNSGLQVAIERQKPPTTSDLVYLESSPDYCAHDLKSGSLGTAGRECNATSDGSDGCGIMCCGRGFNKMLVEEVYNCECTFLWCCKVKCNRCRRTVEKYFCKSEDDEAKPWAVSKKGLTREERRKLRKLRKNKLKQQQLLLDGKLPITGNLLHDL